jgi:hypothetical protein
LPHTTQLSVSAWVFVQPVVQADSEPGQVHLPLMQGCPAPHALPHAPQFCGSDSRVTHAAPHAVAPAGHARVEPLHTWVGAQTLPHEAQCSGSPSSSTQLLAHAVKGAPHEAVHMPA